MKLLEIYKNFLAIIKLRLQLSCILKMVLKLHTVTYTNTFSVVSVKRKKQPKMTVKTEDTQNKLLVNKTLKIKTKIKILKDRKKILKNYFQSTYFLTIEIATTEQV